MVAGSHVLNESLTAEILSIAPAEAVAFVASRYGIKGNAEPLTAERDCNFIIRADGGKAYVFKVANPVESPQFINLQTSALLHIAATAPSLPVQRVLPTLDGQYEPRMQVAGGMPTIARLLSYVPGEVLRFSTRTALQRRNAGRVLAELGLALRNFDHPGAAHRIAWDIKHAGDLRPLVPEAIDEPKKRALILKCLDLFDARFSPDMAGFRGQIVHNDLNRNNVIVDADDNDRITGILDFGDMVHTALINDIAIGAANQLADTENPLETAVDFVSGYSEVVPLLQDEIEALGDLIMTRLVMSIIITQWRATRFPHNCAHILRNTASNWQRLSYLAAIPRADATSMLRQACKGT